MISMLMVRGTMGRPVRVYPGWMGVSRWCDLEGPMLIRSSWQVARTSVLGSVRYRHAEWAAKHLEHTSVRVALRLRHGMAVRSMLGWGLRPPPGHEGRYGHPLRVQKPVHGLQVGLHHHGSGGALGARAGAWRSFRDWQVARRGAGDSGGNGPWA
jgi:hypothetical protein